MELIAPIKLIAKEKYKPIVTHNLKSLFSQVNFGKSGYKVKNFSYESPKEKDLKIMKDGESTVAFTYWDKEKNMQNIYLSDNYFKLSDNERISYLFHEICHYHTYSFNEECVKIKNKCKEVGGRIPERHYLELLKSFNENFADKQMIKTNLELYRTKLNSGRKADSEYVSKVKNDYNIYRHLIDISRIIKLIGNNTGLLNELKKIKNLSQQFQDKLEKAFDPRMYKFYIEYKDKFLISYELGDAEKTILLFEDFINELKKSRPSS